MTADSFIPSSFLDAAVRIRKLATMAPENFGHSEFMKTWFAVAYEFPGLHPDDYDSPESAWPSPFLPLAKEAWRRAGRGEISDEILYPSDAQWAGIYDNLTCPSANEHSRRNEIHARYLISAR